VAFSADGGFGALAGEVELDAVGGPKAACGDGEIVGQVGGQVRRAGELGRLGQVQEAIVADEDELALDGLFGLGPADVGPEGVKYCLSALQKFAAMTQTEVQKIGFEIALLGRSGPDVNNPDRTYSLRSMPGEFTGLQLMRYM
jgi:hypothetical protein